MSINKISYYSDTLKKITNVTIIIPETSNTVSDTFPVLWLLHGLGGDNSVWLRRTSIEEYDADKYQIAVIMPDAQRSFYTDMSFGGDYWTYITQELYTKIYSTFPLSPLRENNFICGASMGGYGALKWALTYPEKFSAVAALSPVLDLRDFETRELLSKKEFAGIFHGKDLEKGPLVISWLIKQYNLTSSSKLSVLTASGTKDFLLNQNQAFSSIFQNKFKRNYTWMKTEGAHDWNLWRPQLKKVMEWLPVKETNVEN
ncbi:alpha/beta hydrolase family protein [Pediococcus parvulus]|uniref:alpha/beta hydrolase n=1 Tax=Pediococcus parvulus TaxID=54062 RepID=UPI003D07B197